MEHHIEPGGAAAAGPAGPGLGFVGGAAALAAAVAQVPVTGHYLATGSYVGWLLLGFETAAFVLAVSLSRSPRRAWWGIALALAATGVAAYVASRLVVPGVAADDRSAWTDPVGVVALSADLALGLVAVVALWRPSWTPSRRFVPVAAGLTVLTVALSATAWSASAGRSEGHLGVAARGHMAPMTGRGYWADVSGQRFVGTGVTRTYYIGADEVAWNYAPTGSNQVTGKPFDEVADVFVRRGPGRIGSTYRKCLYRGYTDATFEDRSPVPRQDRYLGLLGPVIRAEVGDTIVVKFRNACSFPTSVHPHGVFYTKSSEGAPYADGTSAADKSDDIVPTGGRHTYVWEVPERAGPGPGDGSSVMWMYHSHSDEVADTNAGLVGPMVVTRHGMAHADGSPVDVDREVFTLFSVLDENKSPYLGGNEEEYSEGAHEEDDEEGFEESNLMHSVNGYVYGNGPLVTLRRGERTRWYVMSMGTEVDLHTPHWHGNDVTVGGMRMDVVSLLPAGMVTADMVPDNPGTWLFHCHVNDHIAAGMITRYRVLR